MAINSYVKFDGIKGDSTAKGHEDQIEVFSWSHGFSQPTSATRSGAGAGTVEQANHSNFSFTKFTDSSTDDLLKACWNGKQIKEVIVACYRADGSNENQPVKYLEVKMEQVIVSNFSVSGGAGDLPVENVSLDYGIVTYTYLPQKRADGSAGGQEVVKHDLTTRQVA